MLYIFGDFQVDDILYELRRAGEPVELQPKVFDLLLYLIRERGRVASRDELLEQVWAGVVVNEEALTRAVYALRTALGDAGASQRIIQTVRRRGFRFVAEVEEGFAPEPEGIQRPVRPSDTQDRAVPRTSLLIPPFRNLSTTTDDAFLVRGIAEDLATFLSRFPEFDVIPRYNASGESEEVLDPLKLGRVLSARYILTGSLRRLGSKFRIAISLLDGETGAQAWGDNYDRESAEFFEVQNEIVEGIATALGSQLWYAAVAPLAQARPDSLDAWALVQRAVATMNRSHTRESLAETEQLLRRAVAIEPGYPLALATLSQVLGNKVRGLFSEAPETDRAEALRLIGEAGREVTQDPRVVYRRGGAYLRLGQPALALGILERATTLDRSWASARADLGMALIQLGRVSEGTDILRSVVGASRFDPGLWNYRLQLGIGLVLLGDLRGAEDQVRRSIDQLSQFHLSWFVLGLILGTQRRLDQAREAIATAQRLEPSIPRERYEDLLREFLAEQTSNPLLELFRTLWP